MPSIRPAAGLFIACFAGVIAARIIPGLQAAAPTLSQFRFTACALLLVASAASFLRWRVDGRAPSWWASLTLALSAIATLVGVDTAVGTVLGLSVGSVAAVAVLSPTIDTRLGFKRGAQMVAAASTLALAAGFAVLNVATLQIVLASASALALVVTAIAWARKNGPEAWLAPILFGFAIIFSSLTIGFAPDTHAAQLAILELVVAALAACGAGHALYASMTSQRGNALAAEQHRAAVNLENEALTSRYAETMHEVRSTVVAIEGGLRTMQPGSPDPSTEALAQAVAAELRRLRELADPNSPLVDERFDVKHALEPMVVVARAAGWSVRTDLPDGLVALGRPSDVTQIVHGLLANAHRHAPRSLIELSGSRESRYVLLTVDDCGPGIANDRLEAIFERGVRAGMADVPGEGLGLHIARQLARTLGGDLWAEHRPGGGARFVLALPADAHASSVNYDERIAS